MNKYLVELKHPTTGEVKLLQLLASSVESAKNLATLEADEYEVVKVKGTWGGKREGSGRVSNWGDDVTTYRRWLPEKYSKQAEEIISEIDMVNSILESWESRVNESRAKSANGLPSERYKHVAQLLGDLREAMRVTSEKLV
ncbi:hypothetical protein ACE1AT_11475 [Pelatocladus sp. BLCC-F211]|uniref:hypothetical protein n=1 Tax=Pelatocladus sp. BLCC-F211 TaxID=3342752 RepID=UPI0035B6D84B